MRILITGCTAIQCNSPRRVNRLISNLEALKRAMESNGHSVEWRGVDVGEDLSQYDHVVISLAPLASWGTHYMGGALWAFMHHPRITLTADDWQVRGIASSALGLWKRDDYFQKTIWSHWSSANRQVDLSYRDILKQACFLLAHPTWPWPMLVPCWEGGNLSLLRLPSVNLIPYDPSPFMSRYDYPDLPIESKERCWIFASLTSKNNWLDKQTTLKWPIKKFGNVRQGQQKLPEHELAIVYAKSWGIMSPPHDVSAAGWFRVRFWMAAEAGCVVYCGPEEARILGPSYKFVPRNVEQYPDSSLRALAEDQMADLKRISWTKEHLQDVVERIHQA